MKSRYTGFTLLEMLIVMAIFGIIAATQLSGYTTRFNQELSYESGVRIANLVLGVRARAQDTIVPLATGEYNNYVDFKFSDCGSTENNGIPEDIGNGSLTRTDFPEGTLFLPCPFRQTFQEDGIEVVGNEGEALDAVTIVVAGETVTLRDELEEDSPAMVHTGDVFNIRLDIGDFLYGDDDNRLTQLTNLVDGFESSLVMNGIAVPDQVQIFPYTMQEIEATLDTGGARATFLEVSIGVRRGEFLRADGSVNIEAGSPLCWTVMAPGGAPEEVCLNVALDGLNDQANINLTSSTGRDINVVTRSQGQFVNQDVEGNSRTSPTIYSVNTNERVPVPVCPVGTVPSIAASISGFTDSQLADAVDGNWGDMETSAPDYGTSSEVGLVGVGWRRDGNDWVIESNVASMGTTGGSDSTASRFNVMTWCGIAR